MFGPTATFILASVLYNSNESLSVDINEYFCLVEAIHFEAKGEDYEGKLAVANVVANRVESKMFPDSWCGVINQPKQFSYKNGKTVITTVKNRIEEESLRESATIATLVVNGMVEDNTNGADHYFAHRKVTPFWYDERKVLAVIDNHTFLDL